MKYSRCFIALGALAPCFESNFLNLKNGNNQQRSGFTPRKLSLAKFTLTF